MYEGLQGGELAASLTPQQRMDMIQMGYNPLDPEDVKRYKQGQRPTGSLREVAGATKYQNLGGGTIDGRDKALLQEANLQIDPVDISNPTNIREHINKQLELSYNSREIDLNEKLASRLNLKQSTSPSSKKIQLTEEKAQQLGYALGVRYINAFINNIKNPSDQNRIKVEQELKKVKLAESKIPKQYLEHYKKGVSIAEKELHNKLKNK